MAYSPLKWVVLLLALAGTPAGAAPQHGDFSSGLYTAPGQLFSVKSPLGPSPILFDSFLSTTGAVTFIGAFGQLFGVFCTPDLDVLAGAAIDVEVDTAILRNWFREAAFPGFFAYSLPGASILREEPGTFEGQPAWIAVVHLPGGSPVIRADPATGEVTRGDSWRGTVVFSRGGQTYLLMTDAITEIAGSNGRVFDASAPDWSGFLPRLAQFYRGMTFQETAGDRKQGPRISGAGL